MPESNRHDAFGPSRGRAFGNAGLTRRHRRRRSPFRPREVKPPLRGR
jgi:hypothetical protein